MAKFTTVSAADLVRKDMFLEGLRFATGETRKVQAKRLGIPLKTLERIENGTARALSEKTWQKIAKGLQSHSNANLKAARIYTRAGPLFITENMREKLRRMSLSPKGRAYFRARMREFDETDVTPADWYPQAVGAA